jgi:hypothetical protein
VVGVLAAALIGTGSAAAAPTKICHMNLATCGTGNFLSGSTFTLKGTVFFGGGFTCSSTIEIKLTAGSGTPLPSELSVFTITGCTPSTCVVTVKNLPYELNMEALTGGNGNGKIVDGTSWPVFEVSGCQPNCVYRAATALPESITGGTVAIFKSSGGILTGTGVGCETSLRPSMVHETESFKSGGFYVTN